MQDTTDLDEIKRKINALQGALQELAAGLEERLAQVDRRVTTLEAHVDVEALGGRLGAQIGEVRHDIARLGEQLNTMGGMLLERLITNPAPTFAPPANASVGPPVLVGPPQPPPNARSRFKMDGRELPLAHKG